MPRVSVPTPTPTPARTAHELAIGSLVNRPLFVAIAVIAAGVMGSFWRDAFADGRTTTRSEVRITELETYVVEQKRTAISREEFNRLDQQLQQKAGREELLSIQRRIDDVRQDLVEIKTAVLLRVPGDSKR